MKKFINQPQDVTRELLEGFALAYDDFVRLEKNRLIVSRKLDTQPPRVSIVGMGGSGHEPAPIGFVGPGMLDVSVSGNIFVSPGADAVTSAILRADRGKGVLLIVLNHAADLIAAHLAVESCVQKGIDARMVIIQEDISAAPRSNAQDRRGLVGCIPAYKIAGAAAGMGKSLDEVTRITQRFADQMATLAVGVRGATHPVTGALLAKFDEKDMEIGMGQHGEEGGGRQPLRSADDTATIMLGALLKDLNVQGQEKVLLLINGMGATTLMELLIVYRKCVSFLKEKHIELVAKAVGNFLTVQEAAGFQMFIARMDEQLLTLWNEPCNTPCWKKS